MVLIGSQISLSRYNLSYWHVRRCCSFLIWPFPFFNVDNENVCFFADLHIMVIYYDVSAEIFSTQPIRCAQVSSGVWFLYFFTHMKLIIVQTVNWMCMALPVPLC